MTRRAPPRRICLAVVLALTPLLILAGCGGLLPSPQHRDIYRVSPAVNFTAPLPRITAQLVVAAPTAPGDLDTKRIALSRASGSIDYFDASEWSDRATFVVQDALVAAFRQSGSFPAVGPDNADLRADWLLNITVRDFEAAYDSPDKAPKAVVRLDAQLLHMPDRRVVAQQSFGHAAPAMANAIPDIAHAFDAALGGSVQDIVTWVATQGNRLKRMR
ncbi:MAG TPA: ABC-type transport auxiliary lipoprotein family protein [Stellaceae bacterium]|jgi:cholesterol transport system auxiliary component|nr:ABC-type transport auxiliary lipoprotein family protein [Stellaceae bacterium]